MGNMKKEKPKLVSYAVVGLNEGPLGTLSQIITFLPGTKGFRQVYRFLMADGKDGENELGITMTKMSGRHKGDNPPYMEELDITVLADG